MKSVNDSRALTGKNKGLNRAERTKVQPGSDRAKLIHASFEGQVSQIQAEIEAGKELFATEMPAEARKNLKQSMRKLYGQRDRYTRLVKAAKIKANS